MKLACEKNKERFAEMVVEEEKLWWRAVDASIKEVLPPRQAKKFLNDIAVKVRRHGTRWHACAGPLLVHVDAFERICANARSAADRGDRPRHACFSDNPRSR